MKSSNNCPSALDLYRLAVEHKERVALSPVAARSADHSRFFGKEDDHRLPYKRDVDRIVHSKAYARYIDKTQVVYLVTNDHITHRALHVQLVSNFARGIAEILRLNLDLVEAIALGHDVGHPPFGHEGEEYLSALCQKHTGRAFAHPAQTCRLYSLIEPLNLGLATLDGFLCHDGAMAGPVQTPEPKKNWEAHFSQVEAKFANPELNFSPMTTEGCLVKLCDTLSYVGRDIEDAITLKIISRKDVPETCLGNSNKSILTTLARDVIENSYDSSSIAMSDHCFDALSTLRSFNFDHIYRHPAIKVESTKIERSYRILFEELLNDRRENGEKSYVFEHFTKNKSSRYLEETHPAQEVVDFISGMTDRYFIKTMEAFIVPAAIHLEGFDVSRL